MEEKRQNSLEIVLLKLGELTQITSATEKKVTDLNEKVAFQNGRIGKIEITEAEKKGYFRAMSILVWVLTAVVIPMALIIFKEWISK